MLHLIATSSHETSGMKYYLQFITRLLTSSPCIFAYRMTGIIQKDGTVLLSIQYFVRCSSSWPVTHMISILKNIYKVGVQVGSEGSVPVNDSKSNSRYVSCSKPSLHHHKAPLTLTLMALYKYIYIYKYKVITSDTSNKFITSYSLLCFCEVNSVNYMQSCSFIRIIYNFPSMSLLFNVDLYYF